MVVIIVLSMSKTIVSKSLHTKCILTFDTCLDSILNLWDISEVDWLRCGFFLASELFLHGGDLLREEKHAPFLCDCVVFANVYILVVLFLFHLVEQVVFEIGLGDQGMGALDVHFFHKTAHIYHYFHISRLLLSILTLIPIFILLRELFVFLTIGIVLVRLFILTILTDALMKSHSLAVQIIFAKHEFSRTTSVLGAEATLQSAIRRIKWPLWLNIITFLRFLTIIWRVWGHANHFVFYSIYIQDWLVGDHSLILIQLLHLVIFYNV